MPTNTLARYHDRSRRTRPGEVGSRTGTRLSRSTGQIKGLLIDRNTIGVIVAARGHSQVWSE
jgi:hypothetical protein